MSTDIYDPGDGTALAKRIVNRDGTVVGTGAVLGGGTALIGQVAVAGKASATGDTEITAVTAGADAVSNTSNRLAVSAWLQVFNGTTWDRVRESNVAGSAIAAPGVQGVNPIFSNGSNFIPGFNAAATGDANTGGGFAPSLPMGYNGSTYDRLRAGAVANVAAATGFLSNLCVGIYNATAPTLTDGRYNALQLDINGNLKTSSFEVALTMTHTTGSASNSTAAMLASNANRKYALLQNDGAVDVYIKIGAAGVANQGIRLTPNGGSFEMSMAMGNLATGAINGITVSGSATVLVCEGV